VKIEFDDRFNLSTDKKYLYITIMTEVFVPRNKDKQFTGGASFQYVKIKKTDAKQLAKRIEEILDEAT